MADYNWTGVGGGDQYTHSRNGGTIVGNSEFGKNKNNGNAMQPDAFYSDMFLERKRFKADELVFAQYAEKRSIKKGLDTINLRRYQPLKAHIVPLVEGLPPKADRAHGKAIIAKTRQYGRFMEFTDLFDYKVADPVIEEYTMELADVANETIDLLAQAALLAEAQVFFPVASNATDINALVRGASTNKEHAKPTFDDLRVIKLTMEVAKVKTIDGKYKVLVSPSVFFDLQTDPTIENFMNYGQSNSPMATDSIPSVYGLSIVKAPTAKTESVTTPGQSPVTAIVHHSIFLGAKAYSRIDIAGGDNVQFITKGLGSAGTNDPLDQRRTFGWKIMAIGFKVTDPDAVVDYMSVPSQAEIITGNFDYVSDVPKEIGITDEMVTQRVELKGDGTDFQAVAAKSNVAGLGAADLFKVGTEKGLSQTVKPQFAKDVETPTDEATIGDPGKAKDVATELED